MNLRVGDHERDRCQEALSASRTVRILGHAVQQPAGPDDDPEAPFRRVQLQAEPREKFNDECAVPDTLGRLGKQLPGYCILGQGRHSLKRSQTQAKGVILGYFTEF